MSRGLGDVYKTQGMYLVGDSHELAVAIACEEELSCPEEPEQEDGEEDSSRSVAQQPVARPRDQPGKRGCEDPVEGRVLKQRDWIVLA